MNRLRTIGEALVIAIVPVATWGVLRFSLINQEGYIDPWFYTGYGQIFQSMHENFGWPYYAVRFSVIALNEAASLVPVDVGYAILRYVLVLLCGVPLYLWARASFGRGVALLSYLFLFWNPLLPRIVLWDLTTFVSVPTALAGMALWLLADRAGFRFLAGLLWMASIAAHPFTGTAIGTFVAVQAIRRLRAGEILRLVVRDVLVPGAGAAVCLLFGLLYYRMRIGAFDPGELLDVTLSAIAAGNEFAAAHRTPVATWLLREYHVFVPLLSVVLGAVLLRRRLAENTAVASVWWFAAAYSLFFAVYQFVFGRFVLETFYYFAHLTPVVFLLVPVILSEIASAAPVSSRRRVLVAGAIALALFPAINRFAPARVAALDIAASHSTTAAVLLATAGLFVTGTAGWLIHRGRGTMAAAAVFLLLVQTLTLLHPAHQFVFDSRRAPRERDLYLAASAMLKVFESYSRPDAPVRLWFCSTDYSLTSMASSVLLSTLHQGFETSGHSCLSRIELYERRQLLNPPAYVMMLDETGSSFTARDEALRTAGFSLQEITSKTVGGSAFHARLRLVRLTRIPSEDAAGRASTTQLRLLAEWIGDGVRQSGEAITYASGTAKLLARDADGNWTFAPTTARDHFATRWVPVPHAVGERVVTVEVVASPRAAMNCVLHVQNQRFENIGAAPCSADSAQTPALTLPADVTSIRMYVADDQRRPIVLPRSIRVTQQAADRAGSSPRTQQ